MADLRFECHGSVWLCQPLTVAGRKFLADTAPDDAQFLGDAMAIEPRYVEGVVAVASIYQLEIE